MNPARLTPQQLAQRNDARQIQDWIITETEPRKILELFHEIAIPTHKTEYELARTTIEILISEQHFKAAQIMERQTTQLVFLTRALVGLTIGLLIFTVVLAIRH